MRKPIIITTFILAFMLVWFLCGCSSSITSSDLVGYYQAKHSLGVENIDLLTNGSYNQVISVNNGKTWKTTGKWTFAVGSTDELYLKDALSVDLDGKGVPGATKTDWVMHVRRSRGVLTLNFDDDLGINFERVE